MAAETQYTANTGMVTISTANSNLDGTGTLGTVITGASNGTLIKNIIIKAVGTGASSTTEGMVRLFEYDGSSNTRLLQEVFIPNQGQSSTNPTFEAVIPMNFKLASGHSIKASTENAETFNVIAEGLDFSYYASSVRPESSNYTANTGLGNLTTQNSNLDGSGTLLTLVTAASSPKKGLAINSVNLKAYTGLSRGMVRLYIQDSGGTGASNTFLFKEVTVEPTRAASTFPSWHQIVEFTETLQIEPGYKICASIETAASENVACYADAMDWTYPS